MLGLVAMSVRWSPRMLAVAGAAGALFIVFLGAIVVQRLATLSLANPDMSLSERVVWYTAAWHIFREAPAFGLGWGAWYDVGEIVRNGRYVETIRPHPDAVATVHSAYLQILVKTGLLGLVAFLAILLHGARAWWRAWRLPMAEAPEARRAYLLFAGAMAGCGGYLVHSAAENFFQWPVMAQSFWLLWGTGLAMAARRVGPEASGRNDGEGEND